MLKPSLNQDFSIFQDSFTVKFHLFAKSSKVNMWAAGVSYDVAWTHWLTFASFATMVAHILPSFTIINHISFSVCRSFATLLPRYGKRRTRWIVSSAFFNPVPRIVPPSWTKSERLQRGVSQGIFPENGCFLLPSGYD